LIVRIDATSPVPVGEQLRAQIERLVVSGQLPAGARLPAIRHLAADLGLARGTVAKAYEQLARAGLVVSAGRAGTVAAASAGRADRAALDVAAEQLVLVAKQMGARSVEAHQAVDSAWRRFGAPAGSASVGVSPELRPER
jgi:DNA-binding transcriptional regulator YhcF (GntR family)